MKRYLPTQPPLLYTSLCIIMPGVHARIKQFEYKLRVLITRAHGLFSIA